MKNIDFLEHGGGHFHIRHHGLLVALPDPRAQHFQWVLQALALEHVPGTPDDVPEWQRSLVFERWRAAWELPTFREAQRLAYLVDHYRSAISYDLATCTPYDLGTLWRARRWTLLLDIVDHLPAHSWYASTVSMDEEHARMMAEALAEREQDDDAEGSGPPLTTWTPEVAVLTNVLDAVRGVQYAVIAANSEGGKAPEAPKPAPRPTTPLERAMRRADFERRKAKHESLVARLLPSKGRDGSPVH